MPRVNTCRLFRHVAGELEGCFQSIITGAGFRRYLWRTKLAGLITLSVAFVLLSFYSSVTVAKNSGVMVSPISCMASNPFPWGAALFGLSLLALQILAFSLMIKK